MLSIKYEPLTQEATDDLSDYEPRRSEQLSSARAWKAVYALCILLIIAVASNIGLTIHLRNTQAMIDTQSYVGLERNVPVAIPHDDRTIDDEMWDSPKYDYFLGSVALSDEWAAEKDLPKAQRYPWDQSKGIYVLHGFHSLHCVFVVRLAIIEFRDKASQTWPFSHVTHCLHVLREDTLCNADDTPRFTGRLYAEAIHSQPSSGTGQMHICRDWNKLREFAMENSACYSRPLDHAISLLDRYKHCPDGSKPWETATEPPAVVTGV